VCLSNKWSDSKQSQNKAQNGKEEKSLKEEPKVNVESGIYTTCKMRTDGD
jgi:hypothetical protein